MSKFKVIRPQNLRLENVCVLVFPPYVQSRDFPLYKISAPPPCYHNTIYVFMYILASFVAQNVTIGKISAIFYYCYSICKNFITGLLPRSSVRTFLLSLGTSLIAYFAKTKFYDWLGSHGGWVSVVYYNVIFHTAMHFYYLKQVLL